MAVLQMWGRQDLTPPLCQRGGWGGDFSGGDLKKGFVYKRVPHITLKAIANNEEIDVIHAKWQEKLNHCGRS
jgi:hypothetical protein